MKNNLKMIMLIAILLILFNITILLMPVHKGANFWIGFSFSNLAILAQMVIWFCTLKDDKDVRDEFYSSPTLKIGTIYLVLQVVVAIVFIIFKEIPYWFCTIINVAVWGISMILLIAAITAKDTLKKYDDNLATKVNYIQKIRIDINSIERVEKDETTKEALKELSDTIRYSDPVSSPIVCDIENEILANINKLKTCEDKIPLIESISNLVETRNELCKMTKQ